MSDKELLEATVIRLGWVLADEEKAMQKARREKEKAIATKGMYSQQAVRTANAQLRRLRVVEDVVAALPLQTQMRVLEVAAGELTFHGYDTKEIDAITP